MSFSVAVIAMIVLYIILPLGLLAVIYKGYRTWQRGRQLSFETMPQLTYVTSKNLSNDLTEKIQQIDQKAKILLGYYESSKIEDKSLLTENQFLVKKILENHLPEAIADYQRLDHARANQMTVGTTDKTATQLLEEYLDTINYQFDSLIDAMYEQNAQKLLITNRYLKNRFEQ